MIDIALLTALQYAVIEAPDGGANWLSGLWTREEVLSDLNQRQDRLLKDTLLQITILPPNILYNPGDVRIALPADLIRIIDLVWYGGDGTVRELQRADSFEADHIIPSWETPQAYPLVYMEYDPLTLEVQIAPVSYNFGTLGLLYVAAGTEMNGNGVTLAVPDEFAHVLKYGVLADLLSKDGRGKDANRAGYCEQRFQFGIELARILLKGWA